MNKNPANERGSISTVSKILSVAVVIMMITCCFIVIGSDETEAIGPTSGTCGADLNWSLDVSKGELTITGNGAMTNYAEDSVRWGGNIVKSVSLPSGLTSIGSYAFYDTDITTVSIPNNVTSLGAGAFAYCPDLTSISNGNGVTSIGNYAFYGCSGLTSATIGNNVTSIGIYAFGFCSGLTSVAIPNNVTSLGVGAFENCSDLTSATIGNGVASIGDETFYNCCSLTSITIGSSVTSIGNNAIGNCQKLTSISVDSGNATYSTVDGVLFNKEKTRLVQYPAGKTNVSYTIPATVKWIEGSAFVGSVNLTSVSIPDGVLTIGESAFGYCTNLTSVTIPDSVTTIGDEVFSDCYALTSATVGKGVVDIGTLAFWSCYKLASITVDEANTAYCSENGVLFNESKNTLIVYPAAKTGSTYTIPASVTTIEMAAFSLNPYLSTIAIPSTVTSMGSSAFSYCSGLTTATIGNGVTAINSNTFANCYKLTDVTIGDNVTTIGSEAFSNCFALKKITAPDKVTTIGEKAFDGCLKLATVTISSGLTTVGDGAFGDCPNLESFTVNGSNTAFTSVDGVLLNKEKTTLILYPAGKTDEKYLIPDTVTTVSSGAFDGCSHLKIIVIPSGVTTVEERAFSCTVLESFSISGTNNNYCTIDGVLFNKSKTTLIQYPAGKADESYTVPRTVTTIGVYAFFMSTNLHSVELSDNTTTIGIAAFAGSGIRTMHIPAKVVTIGQTAFTRCFELENISVSSSNNNFCTVDGILYNNDKTQFIHCPAKYTGKVTIPSGSNYATVYYGLVGCGGITEFVIDSGSLFFNDNRTLGYSYYGYGLQIGFSSDIETTECTVSPEIVGLLGYDYYGRENLETINADSSNIVFSSKDGCLYDKSGMSLIKCPTGKKSFEFQSGLCLAGRSAFDGDNLKSVTFSSGSKVCMGEESLLNCTSLKKIVIEDGADVTFGVNSIVFTDGVEHTIYVIAPDGFEIDEGCCSGNVKIVYGEPPSDSNMTWVFIGAGAVGAVVLIGVAIFLIRRK